LEIFINVQEVNKNKSSNRKFSLAKKSHEYYKIQF